MGASDLELEVACRSGIARCTLQLGDIRQGRGMVLQLNNQQLFKECAQILEGLQQLTVSEGIRDPSPEKPQCSRGVPLPRLIIQGAAEMYERAASFSPLSTGVHAGGC